MLEDWPVQSRTRFAAMANVWSINAYTAAPCPLPMLLSISGRSSMEQTTSSGETETTSIPIMRANGALYISIRRSMPPFESVDILPISSSLSMNGNHGDGYKRFPSTVRNKC